MRADRIGFRGFIFFCTLMILCLSVMALAQGEYSYVVRQGGEQVRIEPIKSVLGVVDYYDYDAESFQSANLALHETSTIVMFLYEDTTTKMLSLFMLVGGPAGVGGTARVSMSGVPADAEFLVKDDEFDFFDTWKLTPPTAIVSWGWSEGKCDGMVLGPLAAEFDLEIVIDPSSVSGIDAVRFLSGDILSPDVTNLTLDDPILIHEPGAGPELEAMSMPPVATFSVSPADRYIDAVTTFDASEAIAFEGIIVTYEWDFDGDEVFEASTSDPVASHVYSTTGIRHVTLRATDSRGAQSSYTYTIDISSLSVKVVRRMSTELALPGSTFKVEVQIEPQMALAGAGLQEILPPGWKIEPLENAGTVFKHADKQWVFVEDLEAGTSRVISYEVIVPESEAFGSTSLPARFVIVGGFQAVTPFIDMLVGGETDIEVSDSLDIKTAIAHLVPGNQEDASGDTIDLRLSKVIQPGQLDRALEMWMNDTVVPATQRTRIDAQAIKDLIAYSYTCTPVNQPLPLVPMANIESLRTITAPFPCNNVLLDYYDRNGNVAGDTFGVRVELKADQDLYGVGFSEEVLSSWRVVPIEDDGFLYKASSTQWVFPGKVPTGTTKTIIYQVTVPQNAAIKPPKDSPSYVTTNDVFGVVNAVLPRVEVIVGGDSSVGIVRALPLLGAVSRWDVKSDTIDIDLSAYISFEQVQRAIAFWLEDEPVPRTDGQTIDYETMKTIIAYWLSNTAVCDPLPSAFR